jgi:hypothetical protein
MSHKLRVNSVTPPSPRAPQEWMASCSCGWIGDVVQSIADAEQDYDDHAVCEVTHECPPWEYCHACTGTGYETTDPEDSSKCLRCNGTGIEPQEVR